jgi:hypothetical protein
VSPTGGTPGVIPFLRPRPSHSRAAPAASRASSLGPARLGDPGRL